VQVPLIASETVTSPGSWPTISNAARGPHWPGTGSARAARGADVVIFAAARKLVPPAVEEGFDEVHGMLCE